MNFEPSKSFCAGDAPAPDQRPGKPLPLVVPMPKKKPVERERPELEPLRRYG